PESLAAVVRAARNAGAEAIWANVLYLKPGTREHFLAALARDWPEQLERYERLYTGRAYLPDTTTKRVREHVHTLARELRVGRRPGRPRPPAQAEPLQLTLAV
ncbi:MAG TPA: hypothetical protein VJK66_03340, partial [Gaiellaceae bacterium]|nr:hypothetical protein [Gaiellaceae bacterium]